MSSIVIAQIAASVAFFGDIFRHLTFKLMARLRFTRTLNGSGRRRMFTSAPHAAAPRIGLQP